MHVKSMLVSTFILLAAATPVTAAEIISSFHSDIGINPDGSLSITETINYKTTETKHGIYRYIPQTYSRGGQAYSARVRVHRVLANNRSEPYQTTWSNGNISLKIGDKDKTFTGSRSYTIIYTVDNAITHFPDHEELYWDMVGEGWTMPIASVSAAIAGPAAFTQAACYAGEVGTNDERCQTAVTDTTLNLTYPHTIDYGQNVTVVAALPPGSIKPLTGLAAQIKWVGDNWPMVFTILPFALCLLLYLRYGRDYEFLSPDIFTMNATAAQHTKPFFSIPRTPFVYEPLKLTPGEAGVVLDQRADNQDVVAEILELARLKYLKINRAEVKKFLGSTTDYVFKKLKEPDNKLRPHQSYLLKHLFEKGDSQKLSDLKGDFYPHFVKVKELLNQSMHEKHLFTDNPQTIRGIGLVVAGLSLGGGLFGILITHYALYVPGSILILGITIPFSLLLGYHLPRRTAVGTNYYLQSRGLKQTIAWGKWREEIKEKHLFIEEILPFAVSLGVIGKLARDMKDLNLEPPTYAGALATNHLLFAGSFNSFSHSMTASLSYNPSSSSWSGGSGFSGGSSGGGGGGGGGGSW